MRIRGSTQILSGSITQAEIGIADAVGATDVPTYRQVLALASGRSIKFPVRCATQAVADVPFSSFNSGTNTITTTGAVTAIDGVTLAVGDRVLLNQYTGANAPYNGIYVYGSLTGTTQFSRATDANTSGSSPAAASDVVIGMVVTVDDGTVSGGTEWMLTVPSAGASTAVTLNTTALKFVNIGSKLITQVTRETPSGTVNGSTTAFTLANTPVAGSEQVYLNGLLQDAGGQDYSISGTALTFVTAPSSGDKLRVTYLK